MVCYAMANDLPTFSASDLSRLFYMVGQDQAELRATNRRETNGYIERSREALDRSKALLARLRDKDEAAGKRSTLR